MNEREGEEDQKYDGNVIVTDMKKMGVNKEDAWGRFKWKYWTRVAHFQIVGKESKIN